MDGGCYVVRYDGNYRAQISYEGEYLYYQYTPTAAGFYSVESCVSVYADEINPLLRTYSGSGSYVVRGKPLQIYSVIAVQLARVRLAVRAESDSFHV